MADLFKANEKWAMVNGELCMVYSTGNKQLAICNRTSKI